MLAQATRASWSKSYGHERPFTYYLTVTVPACGGAQQKVSTKDSLTTFTFNSKVPTWRIDIAAAHFKIVQDDAKKLSVYVLPEGREECNSYS